MGELLRIDGLYQANAADGREQSDLLRFLPNGVVLSVLTSGRGPATAEQVWKWLTLEASHYWGRWTLVADQLSFFIRHGKEMDPSVIHPQWSGDSEEDWRKICEDHNAERMRQRTEYTGVVGPETLALRWHSYMTGAEGADVYQFVRIGNG